jgi:hypothetical protein
VRRILRETPDLCESNDSALLAWIAQSPLFGFIGSVVCHSLSSARPLVLGDPFFDESWSKRFVPALLIHLLRAVQPQTSFAAFLAFVHSCIHFVTFGVSAIIDELFQTLERAPSGGNDLPRHSELIGIICFGLFSNLLAEESQGIARVLQQSPVLVALLSARKVCAIWFAALTRIFTVIPTEFTEALSAGADQFEREMISAGRIPEPSQPKLDEIARKYPPVAKKAINVSVFADASFAVTRHAYIATCKHFLLAKYASEMLA